MIITEWNKRNNISEFRETVKVLRIWLMIYTQGCFLFNDLVKSTEFLICYSFKNILNFN